MTTPAELRQLLKRAKKETLTIELKRSDVLGNTDGRKNLAYEIIAFANRRGGKLILGVNNDGTFEGKSIFDIDYVNGIVDNICYQQISPLVDYKINYLELDEGDVVIINIPKRGRTPCAFINKREGVEIKNRIYYIRTEYGKRLASDNQLRWLFNYQEEMNFTLNFRTIITYNKNFLTVLMPPVEQPSCTYDYDTFVRNLAPKIIKKLIFVHDFLDREKISFFLGITPYVLIRNLSSYFAGSWIIEVNRRQPRGKNYQVRHRYGELQPTDIETISIENIPKLYGNALLAEFHEEIISNSIASRDIYRKPTFSVPAGTEVSIRYEHSSIFSKAKLILKNKDFKFEFSFQENGARPGPAHGNPVWEVIRSESKSYKVIVSEHELYKNYQSLEINGAFAAIFNFPEEDTELFDQYYRYARSIKEILESDWDHDRFLEGLPSSKFYVLESKLDAVLELIKQEKS